MTKKKAAVKKSKAPAFTITKESVTVVLNSKTYTVKRGDDNFAEAKKAVMEERWEDVPALVSKGLGISTLMKGFFTFVDNHILYKGVRVPQELNTRMIKMAQNGENPSFLMKFWERLQQNPSWRSVQQLYTFLEHEGVPMDKDGFLLTYKSVTRDYKDYHSRTYDNSVGVTNEMARNLVSDEYDVACHTGFHVGGLRYAKGFGDTNKRIIICRVDPADVVCVSTQDSQKVRVCKYKVIGNFGDQMPDTVFDPSEDGIDGLPVSPKNSSDMELGPGWSGLAEGKVATDSKVVVKNPVWKGFDKLSESALAEKGVDELRKYAGQRLKIVGAGKLRKDELVDRILTVREALK